MIPININAYLVPAPNVFIEPRNTALNDVPKITYGNKPSDGGNLIFSEEERKELLEMDPSLDVCVRRYVGAKDFINNDAIRYCLWLKGVSPAIYRKNKIVIKNNLFFDKINF